MSTDFKHPLARDAKVWQSSGLDGTPVKLLVIVTTLELDRTHKGFKAEKVDRLTDAAKTWIKEHALEASDVLLIARPKDWA